MEKCDFQPTYLYIIGKEAALDTFMSFVVMSAKKEVRPVKM